MGDKNYLKQAPSDKVEAFKGIAHKIMVEVERVAPEVKELNKQEGFYLEVYKALGKYFDRKEKANVFTTIKDELKEEALVNSIRKGAGSSIARVGGVIKRAIPPLSTMIGR